MARYVGWITESVWWNPRRFPSALGRRTLAGAGRQAYREEDRAGAPKPAAAHRIP
ncbi:hypothetical protein GCM10009548_20190 [Streptomyces malaysiensis subsp. malaysiensis]